MKIATKMKSTAKTPTAVARSSSVRRGDDPLGLGGVERAQPAERAEAGGDPEEQGPQPRVDAALGAAELERNEPQDHADDAGEAEPIMCLRPPSQGARGTTICDGALIPCSPSAACRRGARRRAAARLHRRASPACEITALVGGDVVDRRALAQLERLDVVRDGPAVRALTPSRTWACSRSPGSRPRKSAPRCSCDTFLVQARRRAQRHLGRDHRVAVAGVAVADRAVDVEALATRSTSAAVTGGGVSAASDARAAPRSAGGRRIERPSAKKSLAQYGFIFSCRIMGSMSLSVGQPPRATAPTKRRPARLMNRALTAAAPSRNRFPRRRAP